MLIPLMLLTAAAECLSLGAVVPFLAVLMDPGQALQKPLVLKVANYLGITGSDQIRAWLTLAFVGTVVAANSIRFVLSYALAKLNFGIAHELGAGIYRNALYQPYERQISRNSSEVMAALAQVETVVWSMLALLNMAIAIVTAIFIILVLFLIDARVAAFALFSFGGIYVLMSLPARKRLAYNGRIIGESHAARVQCVQEGLGGVRDVLLDQAQLVFTERFNSVDSALRRAQASNEVVRPSPRYVVEAAGVVLIAVLAFVLSSSGKAVGTIVPLLGALALGAQRLMPLLQQIYHGWSVIYGDQKVVSDVAELLGERAPDGVQHAHASLPFDREIRFEEVSFSYQPALPEVLSDLNLSIPKGSHIGVIGSTGSGKSTAMDLLLGLLQPTSGQITVDGCVLTASTRLAWQRIVAHVPQAIFLADSSFAENIAFGVERDSIDMERVREAARQAQLDDFICSCPLGYATKVGERGVRISGGQRQRIGIARALYRRATVLVFDEATSSLDSETEASVMQAIDALEKDLTIILIAHRLTTLKGCDVIYRLDGGRIVSSGTYKSMCRETENSTLL